MLKLVVDNSSNKEAMTYGEAFMKLEKLYSLRDFLETNDMSEEFRHLDTKIEQCELLLQKIEEDSGSSSNFLNSNKKLDQVKKFLSNKKYQFSIEERSINSLNSKLDLLGSVYYFDIKLNNGKSAPLFLMTVQGLIGSKFKQNAVIITHAKYSLVDSTNINNHFKDCLKFVGIESSESLSEGSAKDIIDSISLYENSLDLPEGSNVIDCVNLFNKRRKTEVTVSRLLKKIIRSNPLPQHEGKVINIKTKFQDVSESDEIPPDAC